jgi:hypothetical protein
VIRFENIQRIEGMPFEDYLKIPGRSHSFLKSESFGETDTIAETYKIRIGKIVDAILTEPAKVDMTDPHFRIAAHIATKIRMRFGHIIDKMEKQISYTADVSFQGHVMPAKFRLDFLLPKILVLDLKITHERIAAVPALVEYMGYRNQLFGYAKVAQVSSAYLLFYSVPSERCEIYNVPIFESNVFWEAKVQKFGIAA